ncbi:unnamed protein product [Cuscuta campestris]|uniref:Retrotransposon Copia-like N-terminal domain-containing protein n=1 Tax=Cuscuta campestris TaxID=132261 RepID=A0A484MQK6_9ASTE|nr:unnamed protein product [Cuscuta campestris]
MFKIPRNIKFVPSDAYSLVDTNFDQSTDMPKRDAWFTLMSNNNHNLTLRSILDKDKLTGSNFLDWQRNLVIVLRLEKIEYVLEQAIPPVPATNASRAIKDTYEKHVNDDNEVACLMLATMTSDLQKHHESMKAYDMIIHLRQLYQGQARHERFQIYKALFSCKLSVGNPVGPHVLKMIGYVQTLEKLGFELRTELATDLILQSLPELYKQFVVNYKIHELHKPLPELLKMLQTGEESLTKGKGNSVLLVQGGKGKKKFKRKRRMGLHARVTPSQSPILPSSSLKVEWLKIPFVITVVKLATGKGIASSIWQPRKRVKLLLQELKRRSVDLEDARKRKKKRDRGTIYGANRQGRPGTKPTEQSWTRRKETATREPLHHRPPPLASRENSPATVCQFDFLVR